MSAYRVTVSKLRYTTLIEAVNRHRFGVLFESFSWIRANLTEFELELVLRKFAPVYPCKYAKVPWHAVLLLLWLWLRSRRVK